MALKGDVMTEREALNELLCAANGLALEVEDLQILEGPVCDEELKRLITILKWYGVRR